MLESSYVYRSGYELSLSNHGQMELLRGMAEQGKMLRTRVLGFSMSPFIRNNDILTLSPMRGQMPHLGDVVAFILPGMNRMAIHRIVGRTDIGWILHGDNYADADGIIPTHCILARVTRIERMDHTVRWGLGPERILIAWLVKQNILFRMGSFLRGLRHFIKTFTQ
jgi:hypothetical protein